MMDFCRDELRNDINETEAYRSEEFDNTEPYMDSPFSENGIGKYFPDGLETAK